MSDSPQPDRGGGPAAAFARLVREFDSLLFLLLLLAAGLAALLFSLRGAESSAAPAVTEEIITASPQSSPATPLAEAPTARPTEPPYPPPAVLPLDFTRLYAGTAFIVRGTGQPGDSIVLYGNDTPLAQAVVDEDGNWEAGVLGLPVGEYVLSATASDGDRVSDPAPLGFVIMRPADLTVDVLLPDSLPAGSALTLSGQGLAGQTVILTAGGPRGDLQLGTTTVDEDGRWTLTAALPDTPNPYGLTLTMQDEAGEASAALPLGSIIVRAEPTATVTTSPTATPSLTPTIASTATLPPVATPQVEALDLGEYFAGEAFTVRGRAEAGQTIILLDNGDLLGSVEAASDGTWQIPVPDGLAPGDHTLTVIAAGGSPVRQSASAPLGFVVVAQPTATATLTATDTHTPVPPTATHTPVPPTATHTSVPPTATHTSVPATATRTMVPATATLTSVPATATRTMVPATATPTSVPATATHTSVAPTASPTAAPGSSALTATAVGLALVPTATDTPQPAITATTAQAALPQRVLTPVGSCQTVDDVPLVVFTVTNTGDPMDRLQVPYNLLDAQGMLLSQGVIGGLGTGGSQIINSGLTGTLRIDLMLPDGAVASARQSCGDVATATPSFTLPPPTATATATQAITATAVAQVPSPTIPPPPPTATLVATVVPITITLPQDGAEAPAGLVTFGGTAPPGAQVTLQDTSGTVYGTAISGPFGLWQRDADLGEVRGAITFFASASDADGNLLGRSGGVTLTVVGQITPPTGAQLPDAAAPDWLNVGLVLTVLLGLGMLFGGAALRQAARILGLAEADADDQDTNR